MERTDLDPRLFGQVLAPRDQGPDVARLVVANTKNLVNVQALRAYPTVVLNQIVVANESFGVSRVQKLSGPTPNHGPLACLGHCAVQFPYKLQAYAAAIGELLPCLHVLQQLGADRRGPLDAVVIAPLLKLVGEVVAEGVDPRHDGPRSLVQGRIVKPHDLLDGPLVVPGVELLRNAVLDPCGDALGQPPHRAGQAVGLRQNLDVLRAAEKPAHIHPGPAVDRLIVVPRDHHLLGRLRHVPDHGPLQRRQILCLVGDQEVEVDRLGHGWVQGDHVGKVRLAHLGLVLFVLLMDLHQLGVAK